MCEDGQIVAAHGFRDMETKIRLASWGPALLPGHDDKAPILIRRLLEHGKRLGKDRAVVVLRGRPDGEDVRWYVDQHQSAGIKPIMTRLDMEARIDDMRCRQVPEPEGAAWHDISISNLDDFLPLYGEVFKTSESPLARSWAQDITRRRWWFEQVAEGQEGDLIPGGWVTLSIGGEPVGILLVTKESRTRANISDLGLVERARGKQLGWVLINRAVSLARREGADTMCLGVEVENRVAISFYEAAGFRAASRTTVLLKRF